MNKKIFTLCSVALLASLVIAGCASKTSTVDQTPGDKSAVGTTPAQPSSAPAQPSAQPSAVVDESVKPAAQVTTENAQGGSTQAAPTPAPTKKEEVVAPSAPAAKVELLQKIYFDYDKSAIRADAKAQLDKNYEYLAKNGSVKLQVVGHCDERGTSEYNMALGDRRANSAKSYLVNRGIAATRLDTLSKGEEEPTDPGHDENAWSKNRRAEFLAK